MSTVAETPTTPEVKIDVRTHPIMEPKNNVMAFASVTINDMIAINGIRVIEGQNGLFAQMPQTKDNKGNFRDVAFPVTKELRAQLNDTVVGQYAQDINSVLNQIKDRHKAMAKAPTNDTPVADKVKGAKASTGPDR